ncbi:MAG: ArsR family transcriptional regulator [Pseudomonadota bacterium]
MSFNEHVTKDRRLVILRLLSETPGHSSNDSILDAALDQYGHRANRDQVRGDLTWLAEQELLTLEIIGETVFVATLTGRGQDVSEGTASHPGVKRPRAGE